MSSKKPTLLIAWSQDIHWRNLYASGLLAVLAKSFSRVVLVGAKSIQIPPELSNVESYGSRWFSSDPVMNKLARIHQIRSYILDGRFKESDYRLSILKNQLPVWYRLAKYCGPLFRAVYLIWVFFRALVALVLLKKGPFDLFLSHSYIWESYDSVLGMASRLRGTPWATMVTQWDNPSTKGRFHLKPDYALVWGEINAREVARFQQIPIEKVIQLSPPHFIRMLEVERSHTALKKRVLYIGVSETNYSCESQFVDALVRLFSEDPEFKEIELVIRPHPNDRHSWAEKIQSNAHVRLDQSYEERTSQWGVFSTDSEGLNRYYSLLKQSDLVISHYSTAMMEAGLLGVPSLVPKVPFPEGAEPFWRLDYFDHCMYLEKMPASFVARTMDEVRQIVLSAIRGEIPTEKLSAHFEASQKIARFPTQDLLDRYRDCLLKLAIRVDTV